MEIYIYWALESRRTKTLFGFCPISRDSPFPLILHEKLNSKAKLIKIFFFSFFLFFYGYAYIILPHFSSDLFKIQYIEGYQNLMKASLNL